MLPGTTILIKPSRIFVSFLRAQDIPLQPQNNIQQYNNGYLAQ